MNGVKSVVLALALSLGAGALSAQGRAFVIAEEDGVAVRASLDEAATRLSARLLKRWRRANRDLPRALRNEVTDGAERVAVRRYVPVPNEGDSVLTLRLAAMPIGLVVVSHGGVQLGYAYVNEAGGAEFFPRRTPDVAARVADDGRQSLVSIVGERRPIVVAGINQPGKMLCGVDDGGTLVDIATGEETSFDVSELPDYVFADTRHDKPKHVALSVVGGCVATGLIVLAALI